MTQEKFNDRLVWKAFEEISCKVDSFFKPKPIDQGKNGFFSKILGLGK